MFSGSCYITGIVQALSDVMVSGNSKMVANRKWILNVVQLVSWMAAKFNDYRSALCSWVPQSNGTEEINV